MGYGEGLFGFFRLQLTLARKRERERERERGGGGCSGKNTNEDIELPQQRKGAGGKGGGGGGGEKQREKDGHQDKSPHTQKHSNMAAPHTQDLSVSKPHSKKKTHVDHRTHHHTTKSPKTSSFAIPVHLLVLPALLLGGLAVVVYFGEQWLLGPPVNKPLPLPRAISSVWRNSTAYQSRLWGTYRSNVYFGVRPRVPKSLVAGIMWYTYDHPGELNIRHTCEHGDRLLQYGWVRHDGTNFGQQRIVDHSTYMYVCILYYLNYLE